MAKTADKTPGKTLSKRGVGAKQKPDFHRQTVLFQWALGKFGVDTLKAFCDRFQLSPDSHEGLDPNTGLHRFFEAIVAVLPTTDKAGVLSVDRLREYEQNILLHTGEINRARLKHNQPRIDWKYHQYLALLFAELFLDRFFSGAEGLRQEINEQIGRHNEMAGVSDQVEPFDDSQDPRQQLARLALWCATGSGKTLLMHVNVRQFRQYHGRAFAAGTWPALDQIILITPNDGLSAQHATEFTHSGFEVVTIDEQGVDGLFAETFKRSIKVLSIHKFQEDQGKSTVATEAFEGCNLVLVDEGHRGAGRGEEGAWMQRREELARTGFCIEYSATFKEVVGSDNVMRNRYARSILFDYAYRSFYRDGYGKDFTILNLEDDSKQRRYLTAALLLFYQQLRVWADGGDAIRPFLIDKPLWVFVGHTVVKARAAEKLTRDDDASVSDVVEVLLFFKQFLADPTDSRKVIQSLLEEGYKDDRNRDLLAHRLPHLDTQGDKAALAASLHEGILRDVFNAPTGGTLSVQMIRSATGELALRVGDANPFGVVNVGDPLAVATRCEANNITRAEDDQSRESLFKGINRDDSTVNLLVGSRKFTEGWNSWRVSSLGLMRMGKSEGTQIIQLFGRGVRLRGYRMSLRRSSVLNMSGKPVSPKNLRQVETLQVFGVKADYMRTFSEWIFSEVPEAKEKQVWDLPVFKTLPKRKLMTIRLKEEIEGQKVKGEYAFRRLGPLVKLRPPDPTSKEDAGLRSRPTRLNWMPRVVGLAGAERKISHDVGLEVESKPRLFSSVHVMLMDKCGLLFGLEAFKAARGLDRLHADLKSIHALLETPGWYELYASDDDMRHDRYENRTQWQRMAQQLINQYAERFYDDVRGRWEAPYIETTEVTEDDLLPGSYMVETTDSIGDGEQIIEIGKLVNDLKKALSDNPLKPWSHFGGQWRTVPFNGHLYQPLLYVGKGAGIKISPVSLNPGETQFVTDLAVWCSQNPGREIYLLRNQAVTGLGFYRASNFFPDFLLWVQDGERQHLAFVDPKGLMHFNPSDPKILFATHEVPKLQATIGGPNADLTLHGFIISNTPLSALGWSHPDGTKISKHELEKLGVLFQADDPALYIETMMSSVIEQGSQTQTKPSSPASSSLSENTSQASARKVRIEKGKSVVYIHLLLQEWGKPVVQEALEVGLILMHNDEMREMFLSGRYPVKSASSSVEPRIVVGMNVMLDNMVANGNLGVTRRGGRKFITSRHKFLTNPPSRDFEKAQESIKAVEKLSNCRTEAEYPEVLNGHYELV